MTAQQAAAGWQQRQAQAIRQAYTAGWQAGVQSYGSQYATPPMLATPLAAAPPTQPAAQAMSRALAPALASLAAMAAQIAVLLPAVAGGAALVEVVQEYLEHNAWRLAGAASVIWAGEMAGYAQAADRDGLLLEWELDPNPAVEHCADCPALASLPPLPLALWPTLPGEGLTPCNVGCRCSLRAVAAPVPVLTAEQHELLSRVGNRQPVLVAA